VKVLIAGGAGFIGSTVVSACSDDGITPVVVDNLDTGRPEFVRDHIFYRGDIADGQLMRRIFTDHPDITAAIHCAALIVVPDSAADPLRYYRENVVKSVDFIGSLLENGCVRLLFSSTAAIYQPGADLAVDETTPIRPVSPYGRTKSMVEQVLRDCAGAYGLRVIALRYFNPLGADPAMRTGLQLADPSHVLSHMIESAFTGRPFRVTGTDWPTRDGTGLRDYVHVWDLARAHVRALRRFDAILPPESDRRHDAINLGSGCGTTVRELLAAFEAVLGRPLATRAAARRPGDSAGSFTRIGRARELLGWCPTFSIEDAIRHSLQWAAVRESRLGADASTLSAERPEWPVRTDRRIPV
jgi:UDP-glucose 4-epimerase